MGKEKKAVIRKENFTFDYKFNDEELKEKSEQLANACGDKFAIEQEKKSANSNFKDRIDQKDAEISYIARNIREGKEQVTKTCQCEYDFDSAKKIYFFEGAEVGRTKMTQADYQIEADLKED